MAIVNVKRNNEIEKTMAMIAKESEDQLSEVRSSIKDQESINVFIHHFIRVARLVDCVYK